ncbi:MAG: hypothetical protein RIT81_24645 [Deltaproteobacteria bacterium]
MKRWIWIALPLFACSGEDAPEPCDRSIVGTICTIAGNGENGYDTGADDRDIPALEARMSLPQDSLPAPDGTLYIPDWNNHRIRHLDADGLLKWVAGRGELGGTLDDPANNDFNHPPNIIFDGTGDKLIIAAWHNSKVRTLDLATREVQDMVGDGKRAYFGDGEAAITSSLDLPASIALDPMGRLVIMDEANQVLRRINADGTIERVAGQCIVDNPPPGGPGPCETPVQCPDDAAGRPSGKWVCGDPVESCKLPCTPAYGGDEGPAMEMRMAQPFGQSAIPAGRIVFDDAGNLYFADTSNNIIRMIDTDGIVHRIAGQAPVDGVAQQGYAGDGGPATDALLNAPVDLVFGDDGTLYFSDVYNHCVRKIAPNGTIDRVAGQCGEKGDDGDGVAALDALLKIPYGLSYADGVLYIADTGNHVIRALRLP